MPVRWGRLTPGRWLAGAVGLALLAAACSGGGGNDELDITAPARFEGHGSVGEAYALGAEPGQELHVVDTAGNVVGTRTANGHGAVAVRGLEPGAGYTFRAVEGGDVVGTAEFAVLGADDHPAAGHYREQVLEEGLNYITVRDGIEIAATVRLPQGATSLDDGPFPTVIEYSGYGTAAPGDLLAGADEDGLDPDGLPPPESPTAVGSVLAPLLGFASVSVQMRGTGCSGGAFGLFDTLAGLDGYDVVETVAAQEWVKGNKVGMVGISYSGISQLLVAGTRPPSLAAITPLSVTDDLYATGFPGGILNSGFARSWMAERVEDAKPVPEGGQPWARTMIEVLGDERCAANQALHDQAKSPAEVFAGGRDELRPPHDQFIDVGWDELLEAEELFPIGFPRVPDGFDERSPARWAEDIEVPVFLVGALQDEQTGGSWPNLIPALDGNRDVWATLVNGTHIDSLGPASVGRMVEFLDLFVADELPSFNAHVVGLAGGLYDFAAGAPAGPVEPLRFTDALSVEAARREFRRDPRVRVLFDNGGGQPQPGALAPQWEATFERWPPPAVTPTSYYLTDGGGLSRSEPERASRVSYRSDASTRPPGSLPDGAFEDPWSALPPYAWEPVTGESGVGFVSPPLSRDLVVVGPASVELALSSTAEDTDIQVTLSEVRPEGSEMYVQSGVLRASHRALDEKRSTELAAVPTFQPEDVEPLPGEQVSQLRVPLNTLGHAFREGSRIRFMVTAPGGELPRWRFATTDTGGEVQNTIWLGGEQPSRLVLPVVSGVEPETPQPPCPSLRAQPCRTYQPAANER